MYNNRYEDLFKKCIKGYIPTYDETLDMLNNIKVDSLEYRVLCYTADQISREQFENKADVCAQIGVDYSMCSVDCDFCAFSKKSNILEERIFWEPKKVAKLARDMSDAGANAIFLMSTGDYPKSDFIEIGKEVRNALPDTMPMVANIGDMNYEQAKNLKYAGFTCIYHALRLGEGIDTKTTPEFRNKTIDNAKKAGLNIQVCLEPIGPEHSMEELANQMFWARDIGAKFNGAMNRTSVPGTPLAKYGEINFIELAKYVAISRLIIGDIAKAHCTHEPNLPSLMAGANLLWAEAGPNPRDLNADTTSGRGASVNKCQDILKNAGYEIRKGASPACI